jgi:hypothetical protein
MLVSPFVFSYYTLPISFLQERTDKMISFPEKKGFTFQENSATMSLSASKKGDVYEGCYF